MVGVEIVQEVGCTDRSADDKDDPAFFALLGKAQNAEAKQHAGNHKIGYGNPEKVPRQTGKIDITQLEHRPLSTILALRWFVSYPPLYQEDSKDIIFLPNRNRSVKVLTRYAPAKPEQQICAEPLLLERLSLPSCAILHLLAALD